MGSRSVNTRARRARLKVHIRKKVNGTLERPRFAVYRSLKHMHAQIIDDVKHVTLFSTSSIQEEVKTLFEEYSKPAEKESDDKKNKKSSKKKTAESKNMKISRAVGTVIAKKALDSGITSVVFDRSGYKYHGRVKALAESARKAGLKF